LQGEISPGGVGMLAVSALRVVGSSYYGLWSMTALAFVSFDLVVDERGGGGNAGFHLKEYGDGVRTCGADVGTLNYQSAIGHDDLDAHSDPLHVGTAWILLVAK
jgi:hypothetical protein